MINTTKIKAIFKLLFVLFLFIASNFKVNAQVSSYTFFEDLIGYTPLSGATTVAYAAPWDNHTTGAAVNVALPFTFTYDNNPYTSFFISPNGFITFGTLQPPPTNYGPLNNATLYSGAIAALGTNLISNGSDIIYGIEGVSPNRTMVVQWTDAVRATDSGNFNFQIRLNEVDNSIELSYGVCSPGSTLILVQVGLRGLNNTFAQGNVFNRIQGSALTWFGTTVPGVANNSTVRTSTAAYPDLGLNYKYTPALPCTVPSAQPTGLTIGATSISDTSFVGNSFTPASPAPTNYLIVRSLTNVAPTAAQIIDRTFYPPGPIGVTGFGVVSNTSATSFNQTSLTANTTYYYWIIPYNDLCTGAPFYNLSGIITASATTCSPATVATAATSVNGNGFTANWTPVGATDYVIDISTNNTFTALLPAYTNFSMGNVVSYTFSGLTPLTTYYYRIRAVGAGCFVNSNTITVNLPCGYYTIPYTQNFDSSTIAIGSVPTCYVRDNTNADGFQWQVQSVNVASAPKSMYMAKNPAAAMDDWLFMPGLYLNGGTSYRLFFRYNTGNTAAFYENLRVRLGNNSTVAGMNITLLDLPNINNTTFAIATVDFDPVTSGVYYIGFQGYSIANQSYIVIDDVSVTISPSCFEPTDINFPVINTTNAIATWTAAVPAPSNGYEYYRSTSNTPPTLATIATGSVGAGVTTANLTGLTSSTYYYFWVRGNCGGSKSAWTLEESFSTDCITPVVTSSTAASRCGYGTLTLGATPNAGSTINWYNSSSGGSIISTGNSFTTPAINATTTYYAESKAFGAIAKVGPSNPLSQGGIYGVQTYQSSVNFGVTSNTTLQSIDIFPMVSGQAGQILLRNSSNVIMASYSFTTSVSGGNTPQVITINRALATGFYNLYFSILPASGVKMNTTNGMYPYTSSVANILSNTTDNTFYLGLYNWKFTTECLSARTPVVATVSSPPALTISSANSTICENTPSATVTVSGYTSYNTLVWSPNTGISGSFAGGFTFSPTTTTTYTLVANQTSGSFCGNSLTHTVTVQPAPAPITIIPNTASICENSIQVLNGNSTATATPVFTENFNGATNSWTVANTSIGGDVVASQWTLRPDNYNYINGFGWNRTFHSNDNSQFYLANSDAQSAVTGILTRTTLTSPSFSLAGYTGASLALSQYLAFTATDVVLIEVSIDNGVTWATMKQYTASQGVQGIPIANFANDTVNMDAYVGNSNIKLRFNYTSPWGYVWAIDNVVVSGTLAAALSWTPITGLYTDSTATTPYTTGAALSVVYARPLTTTTYTATITGSNGCYRTNTTTITVVPSTVAGVISADQNICSGATPNSITLSGNLGTVVRWEYANDLAFTSGVTTIANTTTTLAAAQMGVFTTIRYFRAVVRNGICNQVTTNIVYVSYASTTWNGTSWSNGLPTSGKIAIFAGNYSSTGDINACAVRVISGIVTINSGHNLVVQNEVVTPFPSVVGTKLEFKNNASLVQINNSANTGNIEYERITTFMRRYDYTYWSTPVSPQTLVGVSPLTLSDKYFRYDPTIAPAGNWAFVPSFNLMDIGKGYIIRAPQTFDTVLPNQMHTANFIGIPNNGTYTTPIVVANSVFNLIGNPYPSAISADLFLSDAANVPVVDGTIYLWTHNTPITAGQYTSNDYAAYNYLGGVGTNSINAGVNNSVPLGKIPAGQSFFIKGDVSGNATFRNTMRVVGQNAQFFKTNSENPNPTTLSIQDFERHRIWLGLIGNQSSYKQTLIGYCENATLDYDRGFDSEFFPTGNEVSLYSIQNDLKFGIQGKPLPFTIDDEVPLGFNTSVDGSFIINLFNFDGLFSNQDIYLKDNYLNITHNLKQGDYTFFANIGNYEDRFVLVYQPAILGNITNTFNSNSVVLFKPNNELIINSGNVIMKEVKIYDVRGRLIYTKENINASETSINLGATNQVVMIHITSDDLQTIVKKYIN